LKYFSIKDKIYITILLKQKEYEMPQEPFLYDRTLRELFHEVPRTLIKLLVGQEIKEVLETSFPKVEERRVDLLTRLEDDTLFHLEIQSINDTLMPSRMLKYASLIYEHYGEFPKQMVLYIGIKKLKIKNEITTQNLCYTYEVKDISDFDCSKLIESSNITDNIIAILCNIKDIDKFYNKLMQKLSKLETKKREDYLRKLFYLMRLRPNIAKKLREKEREDKMPFILDREIDPLYQEGVEKGIERGIEKGKAEGIRKRNIEIAKSLLKQDISIDIIATVTKLSKEEIQKLKE
jgi:predicted transposase/invertase (TIGR01784 family)